MKIIVLTFLLGLVPALFAQSDTCLIHSEIGISFPPVTDAMQRDFAKLHLDTLGIKRIRFAEDWSFREPTQGNFNWTSLDDRMYWAISNNYNVLLTIQSRGPSWACGAQNTNSCVFTNNSYFQNYIEALLSRYPNQIDKIQFGNEWQTEYWYIGTAQEFIESNNILYNSVQTYSPATEVVLGGFTTSSMRYLAACNGFINHFVEDDGTIIDSTLIADSCNASFVIAGRQRIDSVLMYAKYDIIDLHLYDDVKIWPALIANFVDTITKPIIVSEFGGPNMNVEPYSEAYQADRTFQYIKTLDSIGISEIYYFKLVEGTGNSAHSTSGLIDDTTLSEKPVYSVIKSFVHCISSGFDYPQNNQIKFYPNPADDWISCEFNNPAFKNCEIVIFSADGKLVLERQNITTNYFFVSTRQFNNGYYQVIVTSEGAKIGAGKLIIK